MGTEYVRVRREALETFCQQVFQSLDLSEQDVRTAAAVLVAADARGIPSHGVARLWRYREHVHDRRHQGKNRVDATEESIKDFVAAGNWEEITARVRQVLAWIREARGEPV